jgi:penicillin-binding protein 2
MKRFKIRRPGGGEVYPDEIFLDAHNLPSFDVQQFEGRIEQPISKGVVVAIGIVFALIGISFTYRLWTLDIAQGDHYAALSSENRLRHSTVFANRGVIYDRNGEPLSWNDTSSATSSPDFTERIYTDRSGLSHVLGYVKYPQKDSSGVYITDRFIGGDGVEQFFDSYLSGRNGEKIVETDAHGKVASESTFKSPEDGKNLTLSLDAEVTEQLNASIAGLAERVGFRGGAGIIMDVKTGEIVAMTSYPEYKPQIMTDGGDIEQISDYHHDTRSPFLNRAVSGVYTPGSIVKPFVALGALAEEIISPSKQILSTGAITIPNPYNPDKPTVIKDWRAQGWVDMRHAIAVSSNVYFMEIGGGFEDQKGLGIDLINKYMRMFGFGEEVPGDYFAGEPGVVPDPKWKEANFSGEEWRIGDTYNTSIGQYGFQVTPLQAVRAIGAVANGGTLLAPTFVLKGNEFRNATTVQLSFSKQAFDVVREGMRLGVKEGTAKALDVQGMSVAAKTGTAELGTKKEYVNSWTIGFFPYDKPRYAFAIIMERGPRANLYGAVGAMREMVEWIIVHRPAYVRGDAPSE